MKPLKLIDTLRTICYPPPEPQRAPENVQKEIDSLHDSIKVWAEAGHFREQYRYPNRDFGPSDTDQLTREMLILGVLAVATIYMGLHPKPFTDPMEASVQQLIEHVSQGKVALLGNNL